MTNLDSGRENLEYGSIPRLYPWQARWRRKRVPPFHFHHAVRGAHGPNSILTGQASQVASHWSSHRASGRLPLTETSLGGRWGKGELWCLVRYRGIRASSIAWPVVKERPCRGKWRNGEMEVAGQGSPPLRTTPRGEKHVGPGTKDGHHKSVWASCTSLISANIGCCMCTP